MYSVVGDVWETRSGNAAHTCAGRKWSLRIKEGLNLASRARTAWTSYDELRSLRPHHRWTLEVLYRTAPYRYRSLADMETCSCCATCTVALYSYAYSIKRVRILYCTLYSFSTRTVPVL